MRKPKRPPLKVWEDRNHRIELYRQKIGYVLWIYSGDREWEWSWEWSAFEDRQDAEREVRDFYGL